MRIQETKFVKTNSENVLARADVHFDGFWLKGFKILRGKEPNHEFVTPPSYKSGQYWRELFHTDKLEDWQEIQRKILKDYNEFLMNESLGQ